MPFESVRWNRKTFCADVFTKREKRVVPAEVVDRRSYTFINLDLFNARIAFNINDPIALQQIVIELLRSANIKDRVGVAIKLANAF